jgi:hypothetical protein
MTGTLEVVTLRQIIIAPACFIIDNNAENDGKHLSLAYGDVSG